MWIRSAGKRSRKFGDGGSPPTTPDEPTFFTTDKRGKTGTADGIPGNIWFPRLYKQNKKTV